MTTLVIVSFGAASSFVITHSLISPGFNAIIPSELQSPVIFEEYVVSFVSLTIWLPAFNVISFPDVTEFPSTNNSNSSASFAPPLSLMTTLVTVSFGAISLFVIVHCFISPSARVIVPSEAQSPEIDDA